MSLQNFHLNLDLFDMRDMMMSLKHAFINSINIIASLTQHSMNTLVREHNSITLWDMSPEKNFTQILIFRQ